MMIQTIANDYIQIFSQDLIPFSAQVRTVLCVNQGKKAIILGPILNCCWGVLNEAKDCKKIKEVVPMNAAESCLWKLEFVPIYDMECYFMLSNHLNPNFPTCLQGSSFLWCLMCRSVYKSELKL